MIQPFSLSLPSTFTSCAVFSSPHSGADYPEMFLASTRLSRRAIRSSEDAFVDRLFASAPDFGAPLISATYPRAFVDLNRGVDELDPALIAGIARRGSNPRIAAGLGVIPRVVAEGQIIREGKISLGDAENRLKSAYHPYHNTLSTLLVEQRERFGLALLFDCHSMPHDALASAPLVRGRRPEVILGDRFGSSCSRWLIDAASEILTDAGFTIARNAPFAGGFITQFYGRPSQNTHALQIEIDRSLYMDEALLRPNSRFAEVSERIRTALSRLTRLGTSGVMLAAE